MKLDTHVHTFHSGNSTIYPMQNFLRECYNTPEGVYRVAKSRGMDLVVITDHDEISGALPLAHLPDVIVGRSHRCLSGRRRQGSPECVWTGRAAAPRDTEASPRPSGLDAVFAGAALYLAESRSVRHQRPNYRAACCSPVALGSGARGQQRFAAAGAEPHGACLAEASCKPALPEAIRTRIGALATPGPRYRARAPETSS